MSHGTDPTDMQLEKLKLPPKIADVKRIRRETRPEAGAGRALEEASQEAAARLARTVKGPPPTDMEAEILAAAPHVPVQLFTRVLVTDLESGEQEQYTIVPHDEGDLEAGRITIGTPLGRAFLQEYPGAVVTVKTPGGKRLYRILRVES